MKNKEARIEQFRALEPTAYPIVENLSLNQGVSEVYQTQELSLALTLRSRSEADRRRLVLSFSKVRNFKLNPENAEISFSLLSIVPVNGWEDIGFKVFNSEQDVEFSLFCDDFTASLEFIDND